ncbi:MAG: tetratricopeptide repeat protein [Vibrio sp.]
MRYFRWQPWLTLFLLMTSQWAWADISAYPPLRDAEKLVELSPIQAKTLVSDYLSQRRLTKSHDKTPTTIARDESDTQVRSPRNSINALQVLAEAQFNLQDLKGAFRSIHLARELAQEFALPYKNLEVELLSARLHWRHTQSAAAANQRLNTITDTFDAIKSNDHVSREINYKIHMLRAEVASNAGLIKQANEIFAQQKKYIENIHSPRTEIQYYIAVGSHYLTHEQYNMALSELLRAYWAAVEHSSGALLAKTNALLGRLFFERRVLDKAMIYYSQSADFYGKYQQSPLISSVLKRMGDIYYLQGKYNLALVHYFNAIDHESSDKNPNHIIETRLALADTYLELYNYPLAAQYLQHAEQLLVSSNAAQLKAQAALLKSGLTFHEKEAQVALKFASKALNISRSLDNTALESKAYLLLSRGYEQSGQFAKALQNIKYHNRLARRNQEKLNRISEDAFRQQKEFVEQTLHMARQEQQLKTLTREYSKFQKLAFALFIIASILLLFMLRRGHIIQRQKDEIEELNASLFTHSRSRLRNLRMLNAKLATSLEKSSRSFEEWHIGELIDEPLNDRLRFVMIDIPFLGSMYLQQGYSGGLEMEHEFGAFLKSKLNHDQRIYHFSDSNLLYIERNSDRNQPVEAVVERIQGWLNEFHAELNINRNISVGIADYPFLPRAYTAINDKELLDILLMATELAQKLTTQANASQWVYFRAIDNAPAASFAASDMRRACQHAIQQGLVKVQSSCTDEQSLKQMVKF